MIYDVTKKNEREREKKKEKSFFQNFISFLFKVAKNISNLLQAKKF